MIIFVDAGVGDAVTFSTRRVDRVTWSNHEWAIETQPISTAGFGAVVGFAVVCGAEEPAVGSAVVGAVVGPAVDGADELGVCGTVVEDAVGAVVRPAVGASVVG